MHEILRACTGENPTTGRFLPSQCPLPTSGSRRGLRGCGQDTSGLVTLEQPWKSYGIQQPGTRPGNARDSALGPPTQQVRKACAVKLSCMLLVVVGLAVAGCGSGPTANDPPKDKSEAPSKPAEQETASGAEDSLLARAFWIALNTPRQRP